MIPYALARLLASIAEDQAMKVGVPMAIALTDAEGGLILFGRMDGALPASTELAASKAFTAAVLRMTTEQLGKLAQPGGMLYGIEQTHQGRIVLFGGGLPLRLQGLIVGAIGVSGGSVEQDIEVAQSAADALEQMEIWSEHINKELRFNPAAEIPTLNRLERLLQDEIEKTGQPLPSGEMAVLTGAFLLTASRGQHG